MTSDLDIVRAYTRSIRDKLAGGNSRDWADVASVEYQAAFDAAYRVDHDLAHLVRMTAGAAAEFAIRCDFGPTVKSAGGITTIPPELVGLHDELIGCLQTVEDIVRAEQRNGAPPKVNNKIDVQAAYRVGGVPDGEPLTAAKCMEILGCDRTTLTRNLDDDIKVGRTFVFSWRAVTKYATKRNIDLRKWQS